MGQNVHNSVEEDERKTLSDFHEQLFVDELFHDNLKFNTLLKEHESEEIK